MNSCPLRRKSIHQTILYSRNKEIIEKRIFDEKLNKLETIIAEKDEEIQKFRAKNLGNGVSTEEKTK